MRVAVFSDSLGSDWNGVSVTVRQLVSQLVALGVEVTLIAPVENGRHTALSGVDYRPLKAVRLPGIHPAQSIRAIVNPRSILKSLGNVHADLVHIQTFGPVALIGLQYAREKGIPVVTTWHVDIIKLSSYYPLSTFLFRLIFLSSFYYACYEHCNQKSWLARRIWTAMNLSPEAIAMVFLRSSDVNISPSVPLARRLQALSPTAEIVTLPTRLDMRSLGPGRRHPVPQGTISVLYVGRLSAEKNLSLLLAGFRIFREANPNAILRLAGRPVGVWRMRAAIARRTPGVIVLGEVPRKDLPVLYREADALLMLSQAETQSLVLQEAVWFGLPIIAVDSDLDPLFRTGENGLLVAPNPLAVSEALVEMCVSPRRLRYRKAASERERVSAADWPEYNHARAIVKIYEALL